jgi:hypothetical protein
MLFIRRLRWRLGIVRITECAAVGCAVAAALGFIVVPMLWWRGQDGIIPILALLSLGIIGGIICGFGTRPTELQTAAEADRQLNLHDLLATILTMNSANFPNSFRNADWLATVAAMGEIRCANLRPRDVIAHRLGLRAWSGMGLLSALVLVCSLLATGPGNSNAAVTTTSGGQSAARIFSDQSQLPQVLPNSPPAVRPPSNSPLIEDSHRQFPIESDSDQGEMGRGSQQSKPSTAIASGSGAGSATTPRHSQSQDQTQSNGQSQNPTARGISASGSGSIASNNSENTGNATGTVSSANANSNSTQNPSGATSDSANGSPNAITKVPDSISDLVADYFKHE